MKKANIQVLLFAVLIAASIAAQLFISQKENTQISNTQLINSPIQDSIKSPVSFDIEILKILLEHGKSHLPVISNSPTSID
jgi:hypothetical protein